MAVVGSHESVIGHRRTGLSAALSRARILKIARVAADFWREGDMPIVRLRVMAEVDALVASGVFCKSWRES